jgi:hypothetical protein
MGAIASIPDKMICPSSEGHPSADPRGGNESEFFIMESAAQSRGSHLVVAGAGRGRGGSHNRAGTGREAPPGAGQAAENA